MSGGYEDTHNQPSVLIDQLTHKHNITKEEAQQIVDWAVQFAQTLLDKWIRNHRHNQKLKAELILGYLKYLKKGEKSNFKYIEEALLEMCIEK